MGILMQSDQELILQIQSRIDLLTVELGECLRALCQTDNQTGESALKVDAICLSSRIDELMKFKTSIQAREIIINNLA